MRLGFALPQHGSAATPDGIITVAKQAEKTGFDSLWVWERLQAPVKPKAPYPLGEGTHPLAFRSALDALDVLSFVAGHTACSTPGANVLNLRWYNPALLALAGSDRAGERVLL